MNPALVAEMLKPRDEEIEELKRQVDALCEELENIATAEWRDFDPDVRRSPYEFVQWAQSRARHTLNRALSGDVTKPLAEDVATGMRKATDEDDYLAQNSLWGMRLPKDVRMVQVGPCSCSDHECGECMQPEDPAQTRLDEMVLREKT